MLERDITYFEEPGSQTRSILEWDALCNLNGRGQ